MFPEPGVRQHLEPDELPHLRKPRNLSFSGKSARENRPRRISPIV